MALKPPKSKKGDGLMTSIPSSARTRLKKYQDAIKASSAGRWCPCPAIHEFGDRFDSVLVGIRHSELKDGINGYSLVFKYVAPADDERAAKFEGKQWSGRLYTDRIWRDPKTKQEKCIDFGALKAIASMISGEEIEDGEAAINTIIEAGKQGDCLCTVSIAERKVDTKTGGVKTLMEETIHRTTTFTEDGGEDEDDNDDDDADGGDEESTDDDEGDDTEDDEDADAGDEDDEAPPPPKKKRK